MATLLFGSERSENTTLQLPIHAPASRVPAGEDQVAYGETELMPALESTHPPAGEPRWDSSLPSQPPALAKQRKQFSVLPAMMTGLLSTAAVWLGLALFVIAAAYPLSDLARVVLTLMGSSLVAAVIAFTMSSRPAEYA